VSPSQALTQVRKAGDLCAALADPGFAGIIFAKSGYGAQRALELIDWIELANFEPKVLAGFSDVTVILEAVATQLGWASLFSPMAALSGDASHYSFGSVLRVLMRPAEATEISYPDAVTVTPGTARGVTTGGTLALLATSFGTPIGQERPRRHPAARGRGRGGLPDRPHAHPTAPLWLPRRRQRHRRRIVHRLRHGRADRADPRRARR
jgi:muramoyltetrapeptide carboxypeptidase LdcA involved in peptidoglycan recycling